jgi:hypothetical protein
VGSDGSMAVHRRVAAKAGAALPRAPFHGDSMAGIYAGQRSVLSQYR